LFDGLDGFDHLPIPGRIETVFGSLHPTPAVTPMDDKGNVGIVIAGPCHVVGLEKNGRTLRVAFAHELTKNPMPLSSPALMRGGTLAISGGKHDGDHGHVYALDPATGTRLWEHETDSPTIATPASDARFVYVATRDELVVLDVDDGALFASRKYGEGIETAASVALSANGGFLSAGGIFLSFTHELGEEFVIEPHDGGLSSPAIDTEGTIYAVDGDSLVALRGAK
jgi:outer membrane protein assembly factor BamB